MIVGDVGQQMIGIVLFVWTRVNKLVESHVRTFAHDRFGKAYYFLLFFEKSLSFCTLLGIISVTKISSKKFILMLLIQTKFKHVWFF